MENKLTKIEPSVGAAFGKLTVVSFAGRKHGNKLWSCICECGKPKTVQDCALRAGLTRSCGCMIGIKSRERFTTHGQYKTRTYLKWLWMKRRCSPSSTGKCRKNYFLRGIKVCERWEHSFETFLADMGECPQRLTLERKDNDLGYSPDNCIWATRKENQCNKTTSRRVKYHGIVKSLTLWADSLGFNVETLRKRLSLGWSVEKSFNTPVKLL